MHPRRLATFLLGVWLAVSGLADFSAVQNFRSIDRFLSDPGPLAGANVEKLGKSEARILLRHQIGEINRFLFEKSEQIQIVLALAFLGTVFFVPAQLRLIPSILGSIMLLILLADRFFLTPEITRLGRALDYPTAQNIAADAFWRLHGIYSGLELLKLALGLGAAGFLVSRYRDRKVSTRKSAPSPVSVGARG